MTIQARSKNDRLYRDKYDKSYMAFMERRKLKSFMDSHHDDLDHTDDLNY